MATSTRQKMIILICTLGLTALAPIVAVAAQPAAADPLQLVPAESLFCVRINRLNATLGQVDQFLMGLVPMNVSMVAKSQIARLVGSPDPNGVAMSGDFAVFGPLPGGDAPDPSRIGILVPVSDYQKFAKGNPNVTAPDAQGISRIGPEGQQILVAVNVSGYALVTSVDNQQVLTEVKNWLPRGATSLAQRLGVEELKRAQNAPVWAYANIQTVYKMFGPAIQAKIQEIKENLGQMQGQSTPMGTPVMGNVGAIMDAYSAMLNPLLQETQFVGLTLDPSANVLRSEFTMSAVPDTGMAKIFTAPTTPPDRSFAKYLRNGAVMNIVTAVTPTSWTRLNDLGINLLAQVAGKQATDPEIRNLKKLTTDATNALGGTLAASFSVDAASKPPFVLQYVATMKDAQAFYRVLDEMPKLLATGLLADFYKQMGLNFTFDLQRKADTYKGVTIDAIKLAFTPTDANSIPGQMIAKMYGSGMNGRLAVVNNFLVYTIGADPMPALKELIDQIKSPTSSGSQVPSEFQAAMQLIPDAEKQDFFMTYNYPRVLQMAMTMMPMPMPAAPPTVNTQSNIALAGDAANGKLSVQMALPKQHIQEMIMMFVLMQQQQMQQRQGQEQEDQQGQM